MGYTHGQHWTEGNIERQILSVASELKLSRMPTKSEIYSLKFNDPLHNGIVKHGGYRYWADRLGLQIKDSTSKTGWRYEDKAIDLISRKGYQVSKMSTLFPFDLLINEYVRVDVKVGRPWFSNGSRVHTFCIHKPIPVCDLYFIFALDESGNTERLFIIPGAQLKLTTLSIGKDSKYNIYVDRWDYIDKYLRFYTEVI